MLKCFQEGCPFGGKVNIEMKDCPVFKQGCPFKEESAVANLQQSMSQAENFAKCPLSQHVNKNRLKRMLILLQKTNAMLRQPKKV